MSASTLKLDTYVTMKIFELFRDRLWPIVQSYRKDTQRKEPIYRSIFLAPETYSKKRSFQVKGVLTPFVCLWGTSPLEWNKEFYWRSVLPRDFVIPAVYDEDGNEVSGPQLQRGFLYDLQKTFELSCSGYFKDFVGQVNQDLLDFDRVRYFTIDCSELFPSFSSKFEVMLDTLVSSESVDGDNRSFTLSAKYTVRCTLPIVSNLTYIDKVNIYLGTMAEYALGVDHFHETHDPIWSGPNVSESDTATIES